MGLIKHLLRFVFFFMILSLLVVPIQLFANSTPGTVAVDGGIWNFMLKNWSYIALITSEVMAFLPEKFSGIFRIFISIGNKVFVKKSSSKN